MILSLAKACASLLRVSVFCQALNAQLPNDIRAFDIVKVTGGFNAKNSCTRRKYTYVLPTYLLAPSSVATAAFSASGITDDDVARSRELHRASAPKGSWRLKSDQLRPVIDELKSWRLEPETLARMREALRGFIGTKNFWCVRTASRDGQIRRYNSLSPLHSSTQELYVQAEGNRCERNALHYFIRVQRPIPECERP